MEMPRSIAKQRYTLIAIVAATVLFGAVWYYLDQAAVVAPAAIESQ